MHSRIPAKSDSYLRSFITGSTWDLSNIIINDEDLEAISLILNEGIITKLKLANSQLSDKSAIQLAGHTTLSSLDLRGNRLSDSSIEELAKSKTLLELQIDARDFNYAGIQDIKRMIYRNNKTLQNETLIVLNQGHQGKGNFMSKLPLSIIGQIATHLFPHSEKNLLTKMSVFNQKRVMIEPLLPAPEKDTTKVCCIIS